MADLHEVIAATGWAGPVDVSETDDGHVHVRWNGRHVEGVSVEACAEYIRRHTAAMEAAQAEVDAIPMWPEDEEVNDG